ncbi:DUF2332 domain-containing protein [Alkalibacillus haloalkaliphilus]|uniref:DUF2332 domain-containing protein n=1 Tax=Alkalibacillus haloalkaliphilus TaxID=94136 RepID=A0A511W6I0_9BACI|nr:DUF2332 domain-containing protein [Alkalibacillus haloalkaliphilus]GEN46704.1 hypothetical protein AHA02nite_24800 [Alkalibacillus haloalkaliphilus]
MEQRVANIFKKFAKEECEGYCELYEHLSLKIADDEKMLQLALHAREGQPIPNLLFGAVHALLLKGKVHELKHFYPSIVSDVKGVKDSYPYFKDFCENYRDEIIEFLQTKLVQTNEVRRCTYLYPTFSYIYEISNKPLALIEIGTSSGLQLLWDQYNYSYGSGQIYGNRHSNVHLTAEIRGDKEPALPVEAPPVAKRIGVDLNVLDLNDEEDEFWLNALIWPNLHERRETLQQAAEIVKQHPLTLIEGDGVAMLSDIVNDIPEDYAVCVFHTHVANQMPDQTKDDLLEEIKKIGSTREVFHVYNNIQDRDLHLDYYINGEESLNTIATTAGHGKWFTWKL